MPVMTTGTFPRALLEGVHSWFGLTYNEHGMEHLALFDMRSSEKAYEDIYEATGFGLAPVKPEGQGISYDAQTQGPKNTATHAAYALGFICTHEEKKDNLYEELAMGRARALGFSMRTTKEVVAANVYNRAANASYTFGDGVEILSTAHPTRSGNQANEPASAVDLNETSLEDLVIQIRKAKNNRGLQIALRPQSLIVPPDLEFEAHRILKSTLQNDTANNAVNALRSMGTIPKIVSNVFLTDTDQWFIRTDAPDGMIGFNRDAEGPDEDNDFDTKNLRVARYERYSFVVGDWRGLYGSPGA